MSSSTRPRRRSHARQEFLDGRRDELAVNTVIFGACDDVEIGHIALVNHGLQSVLLGPGSAVQKMDDVHAAVHDLEQVPRDLSMR